MNRRVGLGVIADNFVNIGGAIHHGAAAKRGAACAAPLPIRRPFDVVDRSSVERDAGVKLCEGKLEFECRNIHDGIVAFDHDRTW